MGGDDGVPPPPPPAAALPADEPLPDRRAQAARLRRTISVDEWFLSPATTAPVVVDDGRRRVPLWLLCGAAGQHEEFLFGSILPAAYYVTLDLRPTLECNIDFAKTFSCTVSLAPGS